MTIATLPVRSWRCSKVLIGESCLIRPHFEKAILHLKNILLVATPNTFTKCGYAEMSSVEYWKTTLFDSRIDTSNRNSHEVT